LGTRPDRNKVKPFTFVKGFLVSKQESLLLQWRN